MDAKELFDRSLQAWGLNSQVLMLAEEASELSVAALHLLRTLKCKKASLKHLAEEIADVRLMIEEIEYYLNIGSLVAKYRVEKEQRLAQILEGSTFPPAAIEEIMRGEQLVHEESSK